MRIALFHPWIKSRGGAERVVLEFVKNSVHDVDLYTWVYDEESQTYHEDLTKIRKYERDECIRLTQSDIEELFSIVITKPTIVEIVIDFHDATIPGDLIPK